jgi:hypothetical protein
MDKNRFVVSKQQISSKVVDASLWLIAVWCFFAEYIATALQTYLINVLITKS